MLMTATHSITRTMTISFTSRLSFLGINSLAGHSRYYYCSFQWLNFTKFQSGKPDLKSKWASALVERILIFGVEKLPKAIFVRNLSSSEPPLSVSASYSPSSKTLAIKKPNTAISGEWEVSIEY